MSLFKKAYRKVKYKLEAKLKIYLFKQYFLKYRKRTGNNQYTVVSAVYNVEKYLEEYFKSIINQTLVFEKHINLIMVDDGSTDNSASIIREWQSKYPNNITYIKKENGGQASARNLGLEHIKTPWVTFLDPDDFVDVQYFEKVDKFLSQDDSQNIGLVCCKWVLYFETNKEFSDTHPLTFRFSQGNRIIPHSTDTKFISPSVATAFFKSEIIKQHNIKFDEEIKPNFEDAYFSGIYQLYIQDLDAAYVADSIYFYRKRSDGTSTLDNSWENPSRFKEVLERGHINLLKKASKGNKQIPYSIQRLVLYDLFWNFKKIIDNSASVSFLSLNQQEQFKNLLKVIFEYIDIETIDSFELAGCQYWHKAGLINLYKTKKQSFQILSIDEYSKERNEIKVRYFQSNKEESCHFKNKDIDIITQKYRKHDFLGSLFIYEVVAWIKIDKKKEFIDLSLNGVKTSVDLKNNLYDSSIKIGTIVEAFKMPLIGRVLNGIDTHLLTLRTPDKRGFKNSWLLIDRDNQADDNAEHFYRYLDKNHPEINRFFILRKTSHDWQRLKSDGFNLIPFGSISHLAALVQSSHLISSHADGYVTDYIPRRFFKSILKYKFTFLQHGITRDDISRWLNIKDIDCFVTSTPQEYKAIAGDSNYKFTSKEVVLTGLARHDKLLTRDEPTEDVILIIPTWRKSFVGDTKRNSAQRTKTDLFYESDYAKHWKSLLHSKELKSLVDNHNYKVVFFPHANMQIYIDWFDAPSWMEVRTHKSDPILQKLFRRAKIMITDYSSVFFEFAVLQKALIYYQFDYDFMYGGEQQSQLGYFDFKKDGFGPVCSNEKEIVMEIKHLLEQDGQADSLYKDRMIETFPNRDGKNCHRTYQAICNINNTIE